PAGTGEFGARAVEPSRFRDRALKRAAELGGARMKLATRAGPCTFEDFCFLVKEGQKADLIDGVIYMASPENTDANDLFCWLLTLMRLFARAKKLGKVFGSRVALRLDNKNGPEPDILFMRAGRLHLIKRGHIE